MVKSVEVKNFKSISDLKIELGRVNVFIGENGSGKSNILEAVAFGAAASANKLDKEFLVSRGMRVPEPKLMRSAFNKDNLDKEINVGFQIITTDIEKRNTFNYKFNNSNEPFSKWQEENTKRVIEFSANLGNYLFQSSAAIPSLEIIKDEDKASATNQLLAVKQMLDKLKEEQPGIFSDNIPTNAFSQEGGILKDIISHILLDKYKIYAPENTFLRRFEDEEAGDPLGIKGEGLFRLLRYFQNHEDKKYITAIKGALSTLDWFEGFEIPNGLSNGERKLSIIDRFLDPEISISQNSANEGFLFILFYISLFVSEDTPSFFAIDNLDASFNPKLCKHITQILTKAANDHKKQVLFTTHNPFILDGLDLTDDEQRLFVVYRNQKGYTIAKRVEPNERTIPLSEQWMKGFLGGLPENF